MIDLFGNIIIEEQEEAKVSKPSPFEYITKIRKKQYPDGFDGYNKYLIDAAFSQRKDTVMFANELNRHHNISDQASFDYYYHLLPKGNYFSKWAKMEKNQHTKMIMEFFLVSFKVAKQYEKLLRKQDLEKIIKWYNNKEGGKATR